MLGRRADRRLSFRGSILGLKFLQSSSQSVKLSTQRYCSALDVRIVRARTVGTTLSIPSRYSRMPGAVEPAADADATLVNPSARWHDAFLEIALPMTAGVLCLLHYGEPPLDYFNEATRSPVKRCTLRCSPKVGAGQQ